VWDESIANWQLALIQVGSARQVRLFFNPGRFPKRDRKKQDGKRHCQDQNVSNAFHIANFLKIASIIVYQEMGRVRGGKLYIYKY
jgi:hypothetical protein